MNKYQAAIDIMNEDNWSYNQEVPVQTNPEKLLLEKEKWLSVSKEARTIVSLLVKMDQITKTNPRIKIINRVLRGKGLSWKQIKSGRREIVDLLRS